MFVVSPAKYEEEQNDYFSKVDYHFTGTVDRFQYLGSSRCLLYIKVNQIEIKKNKLNMDDDFLGLYSKESNLIVLFADFYLLLKNKYNSLENDKIENINVDIKVNSIERKIYYYKNKILVGETYLRPTAVYVKKLIMVEKDMNEPIRF
ncbi:hypothetical protein OA93_16485 [Flavobacterium sp. KMS]|uniref:hypothetical protein n=1 Tax=Flavobacterium sp. KMS TaxID=1566023 RepID=UPI00057D3191|nr:hypothetical protein [Flavobacterium sp. KMS]KIA96803.1 hypothetical protein OA93_16485 [Flavobacterium sp. KMS]